MMPTTLDLSRQHPTLSLKCIYDTPSKRKGIEKELETQLRIYACELIQDAGILLELPQVVIAHAQVLFHRFYMKRSVTDFDIRYSAISCLFLSSKLDEKKKSLQTVIEAFDFLMVQVRRDENYCSSSISSSSSSNVGTLNDPYTSQTAMNIMSTRLNVRNEVIRVERVICTDLGFVLDNIEYAHTYILFFMHILEASDELIQYAWNYCNDAYRCRVLCLHTKPYVVACGAIYMAAKKLGILLPENPPWWRLFDTSLEDIVLVEEYLANLYSRPKSDYVHVVLPNLPTLHKPLDHSQLSVQSLSSEVSAATSTTTAALGATTQTIPQSQLVNDAYLDRRSNQDVSRTRNETSRHSHHDYPSGNNNSRSYNQQQHRHHYHDRSTSGPYRTNRDESRSFARRDHSDAMWQHRRKRERSPHSRNDETLSRGSNSKRSRNDPSSSSHYRR